MVDEVFYMKASREAEKADLQVRLLREHPEAESEDLEAENGEADLKRRGRAREPRGRP
jgi:hypothetical protein